MAVSFINSSNYITRTTGVVAANGNYTTIFWWKYSNFNSTPVTYITFSDPSGYSPFAALYVDSTNHLYLSVGDGTSVQSSLQITLPNTWYPIAYSRSGNNHSFYFNGALVGSAIIENISAGTLGEVILGNDGGTTSTTTQDFYNFREWNVALTLAQINAEINSPATVVHSAGLQTFTPLTSDLLDVSGNGNNWIQVGSPTFVSDPIFPSNLTSATAISIPAVPYSNTQNVNPTTTYAFSVWYKYIGQSIDNVIGLFFFGDLSIYKPATTIYNGSLAVLLTGNQNAAMQLGVVSGNTYYFLITPNAANLASANLTVSIIRQVDVTISAGIPAISQDGNDDQGGDLPLALIDPNSDSVLTFINQFPVGEQGNILSTGIVAVSTDDDIVDNLVKIFDTSTFTLLHTVTLSTICSNITSDNATIFYIMYVNGSNHYIVQSLTTAGVLGVTIYDLGATLVKNFAVDPANTIIYYQLNNNNTIKRWSLSTNMALSDLVSGGSETLIQDLLCLTDGTLVCTNVDDGNIKHYSAAGSLLNTYTPPITFNVNNRMCCGVDATTFWYYATFPSNTVPLPVLQIKVSDGTILVNQPHSTYEIGSNQMAASATPVRFGPAQSCPMWITRVSYTPPLSMGTIVVGKASVPVNSEIFTINAPGLSTPFTIGFDGTQQLTGPPGTYSITEVADANYYPQYNTSNGNPNTAIVLTSGALIDLVIVNTASAKYGGLYTLVPGKQQDTLRNQDGSTVLKMINWFFELFTDRDK